MSRERNPEIRPNRELPLFEQSFYKFEQHKFAGERAEATSQSDRAEMPIRSKAVSSPAIQSEQAHARRNDPATSKAAARSVVNLGRTRDAIIQLFKAFPKGMTDEQLIYFYRETQKVRRDFKDATDSGLRSRRAELVRMGFVEACGEGKTVSGRPCQIWRLK